MVRIKYRTPTVTSIGGRNGTVRRADRLIELEVAIPKEMGGPGGKPIRRSSSRPATPPTFTARSRA